MIVPGRVVFLLIISFFSTLYEIKMAGASKAVPNPVTIFMNNQELIALFVRSQ